jgi:hypothetical protein
LAEASADRLRSLMCRLSIGRSGQSLTVSMSGLLKVGAPPLP